MVNYYTILGLSPKADQQTIDAAYNFRKMTTTNEDDLFILEQVHHTLSFNRTEYDILLAIGQPPPLIVNVEFESEKPKPVNVPKSVNIGRQYSEKKRQYQYDRPILREYVEYVPKKTNCGFNSFLYGFMFVYISVVILSMF